MRLYNAQSCTPVGSSSMYVTPKGSPPRKHLPQSPTAFARNWRPQKRRNVESQVASKDSNVASPHKLSRITSPFFDPFEFDNNIQFPMDSFTKKEGSRSSATSATARLTPVVSSESHELHELFALSNETEEFLTFSDPFPNREIDFQCPEEGDLFNDASTWMTSSTLSTKFTNHEVTNVAKRSSGGPLDVKNALSSSAAFGGDPLCRPGGFQSATDPWPDEVFVRTPRPSHSETFPQSTRTSDPWHKQASSSLEAFDPFGIDSIKEKQMDNQELPDDLDKENRLLQYLPKTYVDAKANLRSVSSNAARSLWLPSMDFNQEDKTNTRQFHKNDKSVYPTQHSKFASSPPRNKAPEPIKKPGPLQSLAERNQVRARLDSMLSSRAPPVSCRSGFGESTVSKSTNEVKMDARRRPFGASDEIEPKLPETRLEPVRVQGHPSSHCQFQPTGVVKDSTTKKDSVPSSQTRPQSHLGSFISSAALTSGKARLGKKPGEVSTEDIKVASAGAPGTFLAERVEAVRPSAVFHANEDSTSTSSPTGQSKLAGKQQSSPVAAKVKDFAQGKALQDMLGKRFGTKGAEKKGEKLPGPSNDVEEDKHVDQVPGKAKSVSGGSIALKDDPKYAKYIKMMKMGLPMGAVKNAMERDGVDSSVMDGDHSAPAGQQSDAGVAVKDDPKYAKYMKMKKMGLPIGAIKNAMERDGVDSSVMDGDLSAPAGGEKVVSRQKKVPKDKYRRTRIHWETHSTVRSNTVWAMVSRDPDVRELNIDEEELKSLFQAELSKPVAQQSTPTGSTEKGAVKVIDKKRANNGGITLARIKLSYEEIAVAVDSYDESALTQEQILGILQYLPTNEEKTALRKHLDGNSNDIDSLCECEKFMVAIMTVKHVKRKLDAILYIQKFSSSLEELRRDARLVQKACDEIMGSSRFRKILGIVLNLGNRLNTAGPTMKEPASAVTLESFLKLNQPKAFDKKTTFLQYVAGVVRRNNASLCHFKDDLSAVFTAEKILWESTLSELKRMENELESVRRLALYYALQKDHAQASSRGSVNGDSVAAMSIPSKISVEEEIRLLQKTSIGKFTLDACARMAAIVDEIETAKTSFNALLRYFGEEDHASAQPNEVFRTISVFCKEFEGALAAVVETEKTELREAKKRPHKRAPVPPPVSDESEDSVGSAGDLRKRVSSGMGGVLNELRKPNLKWRRRKHVP